MTEAAPSAIAGPERLVIRQSSWGPFGRPRLRLRAVRFAVVNAGAEPASIAAFTCDPLQNRSGATVAARFAVQPEDQAGGMTIPPGESRQFELTGEAPARPGAYATNIRIRMETGDHIAIPVSLEIPASPLLGIGFMILGLIAVALINFLAGEGAVADKLHDALAARQDIHDWLEANPPPRARAGDIASMDRNFDAAIAALGQRRPLSVIDHRAANAAAPLKAANAIADQLRHDLAGLPPGEAEIADLTAEWSTLQTTLRQVAGFPNSPAANPAPGLAGRLDAFLIRYRTRFLQQPAGWISDEMASELDRIRFAATAGERESARDLAIATRAWLRRLARTLDTALVGYRGALVKAGSMAVDDAAIRARAARGDIPDADRKAVLALLDQAAAKMDGDAGMPEWAEANHDIDLAKIALTRAEIASLEARFKEAATAADKATDTGDIDAALADAQASPDQSKPARQAAIQHMLELWRQHVRGVTDEAVRAKLQSQVDAISALVATGDFTGFGPLYKALSDDWVTWRARLAHEAQARIDHGHCLDLFDELQRNVGRLEASLRERPPGPELERWDRQLDQIRLDMQRQGPDSETITEDCATPLLDLGQRATNLSGEILSADIADLQAPALTRQRMARNSGLASAIAATEANAERPRPLDLIVVTPAQDRMVGRRETFSIGRLDPVWGAGVRIAIGFGDGAPPLVATAEQIRQGHPIVHDYAGPGTFHPSVTAAEEFKPVEGRPTQLEPVGPALGEADATLLIAPSSVSRAQRLADDFLNLRFVSALLIALVVYYWRYHNKTAIFGANSFDYVEAFALGFAANAAVDTLPDILAKFGTG